jgi:putative spermidine/putrescine transport system permease protein
MTTAVLPAAPLLARALAKRERSARGRALLLAAPLLAFLLFTLLVPIGALLLRAVQNPEVVNALPRTAQSLAGWDGQSPPSAASYAALAHDLSSLADSADAGSLSRRLNTEVAGSRSLIMGTYRALPHPAEGSPERLRAQLLAIDARWGETKYWQAIANNASPWTANYLLASLDLKRGAGGGIEAMPDDQRVFGRILLRTFGISAQVTVLCLLLAYPLAWWLSTLPARRANLLMIVVLVPFWTSILVRVAAWIVLLQREGLVNKALMATSVIDQPLTLLFNRTGVVVAMVHILLPFMILPIYSVMKSVPPTYLRAAISLGSPPLAAFFRVYVPQTLPGIGAGGLLVFILAIGYYVTPALLGGAGDQMLSYYIAQYTNVDVNWGMACALGTILLAATLVLYAFYRRVSRAELNLG